jgi:hypothetical protein
VNHAHTCRIEAKHARRRPGVVPTEPPLSPGVWPGEQNKPKQKEEAMDIRKLAAAVTTELFNLKSQGLPHSRLGRSLKCGALAAVSLLLSNGLMANPVVIRINDVPNGAPVIQVQNAPNGYNIYTGEDVADPAIEEGALITLFGVDTIGAIEEGSGRFVIPNAPTAQRDAVDIVWLEHDPNSGDLRVGFNSAFPGTYYADPGLRGELNFGMVTDNWVQLIANETLVVFFKPHTYRIRN